MKEIDCVINNDLRPFVNCIMIQESQDEHVRTNLPLYADGYPGIMFQQSKNGVYLLPKQKRLSELFLYGQTLAPVSLDVQGPHQFLIFQLYPFASKHLLGIDPRKLNDDCYDLFEIDHLDISAYKNKLIETVILEEQIEIASELILQLIQSKKVLENDEVQHAIALILKYNGQIKVKNLREELCLSERTFERHFMSEVGLSPKQFAKIIQFQCALKTLNHTHFNSLLEVGLDSGFTDQSHFIRTFKQYTGKTPSHYLKQVALSG